MEFKGFGESFIRPEVAIAHGRWLAGQAYQNFPQYLASAQDSNVNKTVSGKDRPAAVTAGWMEKELWFYMIAAAAVLIVFEWFTYHRGITV